MTIDDRATCEDQVFALHDGFYCIVDGHTYGPWPMVEYARAGLETEKRRARRRREKARGSGRP
jgi:hypothetical protein